MTSRNKFGKVVPYGVYDVTANAGFVSVGITSDTAEFAVASIRCWLERMGRKRYPQARELTITADCGGSNGARAALETRTAKARRRDRACDPRPPLSARHMKWNSIEHRLFHIARNWPPLTIVLPWSN